MTDTAKKKILENYKQQLFKALDHLQYSYQKVLKLFVDKAGLDDEELEVWEGFASRFSRVAEIFISKYLRSHVLQADPGFRGTVRDILDHAEKVGLIESADSWMEIRALRNRSAHEYTEEGLSDFFSELLKATPLLLAVRKKL